MTGMLRENDQRRRRRFQRMRVLTGGRNIGPARFALLAFLRHRNIERPRLQIGGEKSRKHELVVMLVRQLAAAPGDFLHALAQLLAVIIRIGFRVFAFHGLDLPAGFRHRLHRDHAFGNLRAHLQRRGAVAAMRHFQHRLVARARPRLARLQRDMGDQRGGDQRQGHDPRDQGHRKLARHDCSPRETACDESKDLRRSAVFTRSAEGLGRVRNAPQPAL